MGNKNYLVEYMKMWENKVTHLGGFMSMQSVGSNNWGKESMTFYSFEIINEGK